MGYTHKVYGFYTNSISIKTEGRKRFFFGVLACILSVSHAKKKLIKQTYCDVHMYRGFERAWQYSKASAEFGKKISPFNRWSQPQKKNVLFTRDRVVVLCFTNRRSVRLQITKPEIKQTIEKNERFRNDLTSQSVQNLMYFAWSNMILKTFKVIFITWENR